MKIVFEKLKHSVQKLWYLLTSSHYRTLRNTPFFNRDYYLKSNLDVKRIGLDPLVHYIKTGHKEKRQPSHFFLPRFFEKQIEIKGKQRTDLLLQYLTRGNRNKLSPHPFFDPGYYLNQVTLEKPEQCNPFLHVLQDSSTISPSPYFDSSYYCTTSAPVKNKESLHHFVTIGMVQKLQPSIFFDPLYYLDKTPILAKKGVDPFDHYFLFGIDEKKSPCPLFDPTFYTKKYTLNDSEDPLAHYIKNEYTLDYQPIEWFDPGFYHNKYLKDKSQNTSPLKHFLQFGCTNNHYPNEEIAELNYKPTISILVPVYNVDLPHLHNCIRSVLYQSYPHWQLCLADDKSTNDEIRQQLTKWGSIDKRIKVVFLEKNSGISTATNMAAKLADGEYIALLDNDDELSLDCLFHFIKAINKESSDLLYCDEDLIGDDGSRFSIFRKPAFNKELLLCHNYITHCIVAKRDLFLQVDGCDPEFDGAQDFDLFLKLSEKAKKIVHIPRILYHWRASESSTSINHEQKQYANEAGKNCLSKALQRSNINAQPEFTDLKFYYRSRYELQQEIKISLLLVWNKPFDTLSTFINSLLDTATIAPLEILVGYDGRQPAPSLTDLNCSCPTLVKTISLQEVREEYGLAGKYNYLAKQTKGDFLCFLNSSLIFSSADWLSSLVEYGQHNDIGIVGGQIVKDKKWHEQLTPLPDVTNNSPYYYAEFLSTCSILANGPHCPQEVLGVSGDIFLIKSNDFKRFEGFLGESFPNQYRLLDLCLRLREIGKRNIYTPYSRAKWNGENKELITPADESSLQEKTLFQKKWQTTLLNNPFYNKALISDQKISLDDYSFWLTGTATDETNL